jgi:hypothetical protein
MRWPLDHIFFDPEFRLVRLERLREIGSDHFPILPDLSFEPQGVEEHEARSEMPGDRAAAGPGRAEATARRLRGLPVAKRPPGSHSPIAER